MVNTGYGYEGTSIFKSSVHYIGAQLAECISNFYIHLSRGISSEISWQGPEMS